MKHLFTVFLSSRKLFHKEKCTFVQQMCRKQTFKELLLDLKWIWSFKCCIYLIFNPESWSEDGAANSILSASVFTVMDADGIDQQEWTPTAAATLNSVFSVDIEGKGWNISSGFDFIGFLFWWSVLLSCLKLVHVHKQEGANFFLTDSFFVIG